MPRPLTRDQIHQNDAFLRALRRSGNVHEAARAVGMYRGTLTRRRAKHPHFAAQWDAALAFAQARLTERARGVEGAADAADDDAPRIVRMAGGRVQLRRQQRGRLDRAAEQKFLAALSATANVRVAAAAAGFSHSAFYWRARKHPGFAREMRLALTMGYDRVELALLESTLPAAQEDDGWRHNDPPPVPPMTPDQALQLLYLHHKTARLWAEYPHGSQRRRPGESEDQHSQMLGRRYVARLAREAEHTVLQAVLRNSRLDPDHEPPPPSLPSLAQVWAAIVAQDRRDGRASGVKYHPERALFGGWRLDDWKRRDGGE